MARQYNNAIAQINEADTPLPGRGFQEVVIILIVIPMAGIVWATSQALDAATNQAAWEAFKSTMRSNLQLTGAVLLVWGLAAIHVEQWITGIGGWLLDALLDWRNPPMVEFELGPAPEEEEPERPTPLVRGIKWRDIDTYIAKVLLWKEHEERQGKTSWRQELAREWGFGKTHKALTQMLEDAGALVDYGPQRTGKLVILNRGEIMRRISMLK